MAFFPFVHGAWHGAWCWERVLPRLREAGHRAEALTLTGLGERATEATRETNLSTHVADVAAALEHTDAQGVILVGHSYGGMVITGAADCRAERLAALVYLDAYTPDHGQSLADICGPTRRARWIERAEQGGGGWLLPPPDDRFGITSEADWRWARERLTPHPLATFLEPVRLLRTASVDYRRVAISCPDPGTPPAAAQCAGWRRVHLPVGHDAMITAPEELTGILLAEAH